MNATTTPNEQAIEALLEEDRFFPPPASFVEGSQYADPAVYEKAAADPEGFWASFADQLSWQKPYEKVLDWSNAPFAKWFEGGRINVSENCLDRHVAAGRGDVVAFHWEGEDGTTKSVSYAQLLAEVERFASALLDLGVRKGDVVAIYMPMIVELPVAMLACARIGAPHTVVFGGFSPQALADRISDTSCKWVVTADGGFRRGGTVELKKNVDDAIAMTDTVEKCVVVKRMGNEIDWVDGRDCWYHELVSKAASSCPPAEMDSEDLLYLLYTSGSTAKPKGIMHTTAGYLTGVFATTQMVFDLRPDDVYFCAADIGWVTGHSYVVYGPLANGVTSVLYEGAPDWPDKDRWWELIEKYGVTIFYTAPTAIRACIKWGDEYVTRHDLSSLRLLGSVGEPINPEAWMWYHETVGGGRCPIVDTWWQTETGQIMISPLPALTETKPGSATRALPGIEAEIVDESGEPVGRGEGGYLTIKTPWPGMTRGLYGEPERFVDTYWSRFPGRYFAGDGAKLDRDGYIWLLGRVDDVMNISGHRISTTEVESALVEHASVAEAAVVGIAHDVTGEAVFAFVTPEDGIDRNAQLENELRTHVAERIGKFARPARVVLCDDLPKTRSGKIMRRLLRDIAEGRALGDTTTLRDGGIVTELQQAVGTN